VIITCELASLTIWVSFVLLIFCRGFDERDTTSGNDRAAKARVGRRKQNDRTGGRREDENER